MYLSCSHLDSLSTGWLKKYKVSKDENVLRVNQPNFQKPLFHSAMFATTILTQAFALAATLSGIVSASPGYNQPDYVIRNLNTIKHIYGLTVYPNNVPIIQKGASAVPPGLFNENAAGRISPVGNFTGFDDSIEYFFALAPTPDTNPGKAAIFKAEVVEFTSGCPDVASSVVYLRTGVVDEKTGKLDTSKPTTTLSQVAFWKFDESGAVLNYHAWIPNLQVRSQPKSNALGRLEKMLIRDSDLDRNR